MTASDVVRLADWLKPGDRPIAAAAALLDEIEQGERPWRSLPLPSVDPERVRRLSRFRFVTEEIPLARLRPWPAMGGLPRESTDAGSVLGVAERIRALGVPPRAARLAQMWAWARARPGEAIAWLRRLPLIAIPEFHPRPPVPDAPLTLDDGSHRVVVLALLGEISASCLVGQP